MALPEVVVDRDLPDSICEIASAQCIVSTFICGLTQTEAAKLLGVGQPRLSDLYKGKLERFTVDKLMKWLAKLGKHVTITM